MDIDSLNPAQREAVLKRQKVQYLYLAGAGSGKTRVLTTRIAHLMQDKGIHPSKYISNNIYK